MFSPLALPLGFEGQGLGVRRRGRGKTEKWVNLFALVALVLQPLVNEVIEVREYVSMD